MDDEGLGMGSLYRWAREDNPAKFNELSKDNLQKCMLDSLSQTPNDVARVVHHMYKHEFVCASSRRKCWYQFVDHKWKELDCDVELRKVISNEKLKSNKGKIAYEYGPIVYCAEEADNPKGVLDVKINNEYSYFGKFSKYG